MEKKGSIQVDLFDQPRQRVRGQRLLETIDRAAERFGKGILQLGCTPKINKNEPR